VRGFLCVAGCAPKCCVDFFCRRKHRWRDFLRGRDYRIGEPMTASRMRDQKMENPQRGAVFVHPNGGLPDSDEAGNAPSSNYPC